jgi:integrase
MLRIHILPALGDLPVSDIDRPAVRAWFAELEATTGPTCRADCFTLLRSILRTAVEDGLCEDNPAQVRGAGSKARARDIRPATLDELEVIARNAPGRYRLMVLLAAWCALRVGELTALRRSDVDVDAGTVRVVRGITRTPGQFHVGSPKSEAGRRTVAVPPHIRPEIREHLEQHTGAGGDALLFPAARGGLMHGAAVRRWFSVARAVAGREDLRFHDLRHTGATLAAHAGATLKELMGRLGHSSPVMALRYQHVAEGRDAVIAARLSEIAGHAPEGGGGKVRQMPKRMNRTNGRVRKSSSSARQSA